ncbi:hypothetical protein VIBNISFn118_2240003 [Vibrio nigripulchritudo SFn118]|nr:hypothetical protein VIBNISFn118_2240003 [Vibrio nigripulchritudo SFn118]
MSVVFHVNKLIGLSYEEMSDSRLIYESDSECYSRSCCWGNGFLWSPFPCGW